MPIRGSMLFVSSGTATTGSASASTATPSTVWASLVPTARASTTAHTHRRAVRFAIAILRIRSPALAACAPLHTRAIVTVNARHVRSFPWLTPPCRPGILDDVGPFGSPHPVRGTVKSNPNRLRRTVSWGGCVSVAYVGETNPLDSVVWRALNGRQTQFSVGDDRARRYMADVAPFAGLRDLSPASFASLVPLVPRGDQVAMFTVEPLPPTEQLETLLAKPVHQM